MYTAETFEKATLAGRGAGLMPWLFATRRTSGIGWTARMLAGKTLPGGATIEIAVLLAEKFFVARGHV